MQIGDPHTLVVQIFSARERAQLDVYGLLAVLRNKLDTDDSFELNRVLGRIKEGISQLPVATEEDDAALAELTVSQAPSSQVSRSTLAVVRF